MDYSRGLTRLKEYAKGADWLDQFTVYEAALRENLHSEQLYGPSETSRRDRSMLVHQLNRLALTHLKISFNDLCASDPIHADIGEQPGNILDIKQKRLRVLETQAARYGIDCPAHIAVEIAELRAEIDRLSNQQ